jgi:DNA-binding NarL/FixJ family response regulator
MGASGPGIKVLAEGTLATVAEQLSLALQPGVVVLDAQNASVEALRAIQQIRAYAPRSGILTCSAPLGTEFGLLCITAGASGYISKDIDLAVLPRVLRAVARGEAVIPRAMASDLLNRYVRPNAGDRAGPAELSSPESRLIGLLGTGLSLPQAAVELGVTPGTARRHLGSARRRLSPP